MVTSTDFQTKYALGEIDSRTVPLKPNDFIADYLPAPLPPNHQKRLQTLWYNKLSKEVKPDLDKIVDMASTVFKMPYVLINIIDDEYLHPYSTVNYPEGDLDRESSFCGHAILDPNTPLIIPDTDADWRFRKNIYTTSSYHIRFYAGNPISMYSAPKDEDDSREKFAMGTLCLLDNKPNKLTDTQLRQLSFLANMVQHVFDKHLYQYLVNERNRMSRLLVDFINRANESMSPRDLACDVLKDALRISDAFIQRLDSPFPLTVSFVTKSQTERELPLKPQSSAYIWESEDFKENAIMVTFSLQKTSDYLLIIAYTDDETRVFDMYDLNFVIHFGEALSAVMQHELVVTANRAKTTFIESVSHELRTPLHGILSSADLLQESTAIVPSDRSLVSMIQSSGKNLINVINSLLDFHKWESEVVHVATDTFNVLDLQQEVGDALLISLSDECELFLESDIPLEYRMIESDMGIMKQVLLNLVNNAVKFTTVGAIHVKLRFDESGLCIWEVSDTGKGMSADFVKLLFKPFSKEDPFTQGVGLGLAISQTLCKAAHSKLELVWTSVGVGSTFRYSVPVQWKVTETKKYVNQRWSYATPLNKTELLRNVGEHFERFLGILDEQRSDKVDRLILIDYARETNEDILKLLQTKKSTFIVFCRPDVVSIVPEEIINRPNVTIASTPIGSIKLMEVITKLDAQKSEVQHKLTSTRILIVDDNAVNRNMLAMYCKKRKLPYETAVDGLDAFKKFKTSTFDIILMDIQMPVCDGPTAVGMIRKHEAEELKSRPGTTKSLCTIIMLTGLGTDEVKLECMKIGANGYYVKPVSIKILDQILEKNSVVV